MIYWKIVDEHKKSPHTLYHGLRGAKKLGIGRYLTAERKIVRDGSGNAYYESAFHVLANLKDAVKYLNRFKNLGTKRLVEVEVPKYSSVTHKWKLQKRPGLDKVFLVGTMIITAKNWDNRLTVEEAKDVASALLNS